MYRGVATFTLDTGRCPPWLFKRMVKLCRELTHAIVAEEGADEFIKRLSDPAWFQSLGTVAAFDWNASGLTTVLTAALKEAIRGEEKDLGIFICGGKGKTSRRTPQEIENWGEKLGLSGENTQALTYNSRMAAKVDSALIQDNYQIYHHAFFFTKGGAWTVVQQGMNQENQTARRYHWHSKNVKELISEPHTGIASMKKVSSVLNLTADESKKNRQVSEKLIVQGFRTLMKDLQLLSKYSTPVSTTVRMKSKDNQLTLLNLENTEFKHHPVVHEQFANNRYLHKILYKLCDEEPESYEKMLATKGVGPKTIRALALVSEVIYGAKPSYEDPARYSFAHGGKDATPYPVNRPVYDETIRTLKRYVSKIEK